MLLSYLNNSMGFHSIIELSKELDGVIRPGIADLATPRLEEEVVAQVCLIDPFVVEDGKLPNPRQYEVLEHRSRGSIPAYDEDVRRFEARLPAGSPQPELAVVLLRAVVWPDMLRGKGHGRRRFVIGRRLHRVGCYAVALLLCQRYGRRLRGAARQWREVVGSLLLTDFNNWKLDSQNRR